MRLCMKGKRPMQRYNFRQCTLTSLDRLVGVRQVFTSSRLDQWLAMGAPLTEREKASLQDLQALLEQNVRGWNEQELSMNFIGPMLTLVHFTEPYRFNLFAGRHISATLPGLQDEVELAGEPDGMIATGYREPEIPMFAFTEYKRQLDPEGDPAGQTLAAMLVGQALNGHKQPLYGAYVIGRDWNFMVLEESHYCISRDYSALSPEIYDILRILKALKQLVLALTA